MKEMFDKVVSVFTGDGKKRDPRKKLGEKGEKAAAKYYKRQGFVILDRNYTCRLGELDLVVRKGDLLVFCEVKTLRSKSLGVPEMAVNASKQRRIVRLAKYYIKLKKLESLQARFDVVSVSWEEGGRPEVKHIPAAFTE
ncbi:YraN family protein [bacterium]